MHRKEESELPRLQDRGFRSTRPAPYSLRVGHTTDNFFAITFGRYQWDAINEFTPLQNRFSPRPLLMIFARIRTRHRGLPSQRFVRTTARGPRTIMFVLNRRRRTFIRILSPVVLPVGRNSSPFGTVHAHKHNGSPYVIIGVP